LVEEELQELLQFGHYPDSDSHLQEALDFRLNFRLDFRFRCWLLLLSHSDYLRFGFRDRSDLLLLSHSDLLLSGMKRGYSDHYLGLGLASLEFGYLDYLLLLSFLSTTCFSSS
jgi:hypothetical protein